MAKPISMNPAFSPKQVAAIASKAADTPKAGAGMAGPSNRPPKILHPGEGMSLPKMHTPKHN